MKFPKHNTEFLRQKWSPVLNLVRNQSVWTNDNELAVLAELASQAKVIGEIGSYKGKSAKVLSHATYGKVYCVDSADDGTDVAFKEFLKDEIQSGQVDFFVGHDVDGISQWEKQKLSFDLMFLDADHTTDGVVREIRAVMPLMKAGSIICGHDFSSNPELNDVGTAVQYYFKGHHTILTDSIWAVEV